MYMCVNATYINENHGMCLQFWEFWEHIHFRHIMFAVDVDCFGAYIKKCWVHLVLLHESSVICSCNVVDIYLLCDLCQ